MPFQKVIERNSSLLHALRASLAAMAGRYGAEIVFCKLHSNVFA
jgi:hypothetical protein